MTFPHLFSPTLCLAPSPYIIGIGFCRRRRRQRAVTRVCRCLLVCVTLSNQRRRRWRWRGRGRGRGRAPWRLGGSHVRCTRRPRRRHEVERAASYRNTGQGALSERVSRYTFMVRSSGVIGEQIVAWESRWWEGRGARRTTAHLSR